jgi:hypothetical protein
MSADERGCTRMKAYPSRGKVGPAGGKTCLPQTDNCPESSVTPDLTDSYR